ncbi:hypothetical protein AUEXF2481DRAFT_123843 [Aureobasidium subglaciale EXF-2481]|uniref:Uncharacterized protein n=1 Tax=Aureobasidium subglaciale (strain EXF-2481) TaxID=1043005 RepID=A0A074YRB5_AURSE|nr:uncharacterized protein AUEXF2481DRAFT_123843 [Aureobasidium subglaciale EXF-2481]KER00226.1 hypothetical protein AUEXF2481DRAFT_123843 [Aureobasidium subglaciale EXF-2481]
MHDICIPVRPDPSHQRGSHRLDAEVEGYSDPVHQCHGRQESFVCLRSRRQPCRSMTRLRDDLTCFRPGWTFILRYDVVSDIDSSSHQEYKQDMISLYEQALRDRMRETQVVMLSVTSLEQDLVIFKFHRDTRYSTINLSERS